MTSKLFHQHAHQLILRGRQVIYKAYRVDLPPVGQRGDENADLCLGRWNIHAPGQSPAWSWYTVTLADIRDVRDDLKLDPDSTHQIAVFSNDPDRATDEQMRAGACFPITPINVVLQFLCWSDDFAVTVTENAVTAAVEGKLMLEPHRIEGAADMWTDRVQRFIRAAEAARN